MARKPHRARRPVPRFEPLERRELLAGNLTVSLLSGQLSVVGDNVNNGVTILQLADFPGPVGSPPLLGNFFVRPDATTRINALAPGQAMFITGATNGVVSSLGAGPDSLLLLGRTGSSIPSVTVDSGAGDDVLSFFGGSVAQDLHVTSPGGSDRVSVTGLTVSGALTVEGTGNLDFAMQASHASDMFLKIKGVDGEATAAYLKIKFQDSLVSGFTFVDTDSSLDLSMTGGEADRIYIKGVASDLEYLKVTLKDALITSFAEVDAAGSGELDFSAQGSELSGVYLKYDGIDGSAAPRVKIDFIQSSVSNVVEVDTDGFIAMQATGQHIKKATLTVRKAGGGQQEYYSVIDLDDLFGSSLSVEAGQGLLDFSLDGGRATSVTVRGDLLLSPAALSHHVKFHNTRVTDSVVVDLTGDGLVDVVVADSQLGAAFIKFDGVDGSTAAFIKIEMEDVLVTGVVDVSTDMATDLSVTDGALGRLALHCATGKHIAKAVFTRVSSPDVDVDADSALDLAMIGGEVDRLSIKGESTDDLTFYKVTLQDLLVSSSASLEVRGALDLGMTGVTGGQLSARSSGLGGGKVSLQDFHFASVSVESDSAMDVAMVGGETGSLFLKGSSQDPAQLYVIKLADVLVSSFTSVDVDSSGQLDVSVADSEMGAIFLKLDSVPGEAAAHLKIEMEEVLVSGLVDVDTDGGLDFSAKGKHFQKVELHLRSAPPGSVASRAIELADVLVSSISVQNDNSPLEFSMVDGQVDDVVIESASTDAVSLNFAKIEFDRTSVSNALVVDVDGGLDFSAKGKVFQKVEIHLRSAPGGSVASRAIELEDVLVSSISVQNESLPLEFSMVDGQVDDVVIESASTESLSLNYTKIEFDRTRVSNALVIDVDGPLDLSSTGGDAALVSVQRARKQGTDQIEYLTVTMTDVLVTGYSVRDDDALGSVAVEVDGGTVSSLSHKGESHDDRVHIIKLTDLLVTGAVDVEVDGALDVTAFSLGVNLGTMAGGGGGGAGKASFSDLSVSSLHVVSNDLLFDVSVTGGQASSLTVEGTSPPDGSTQLYVVTLTDVLVTGFVVVDTDNGALDFSMVDSQCDTLTVECSNTGTMAGGGGGGAGKASFSDVSFSSLSVVHSDALFDVSATGGQAASVNVEASSSPDGSARFYTVTFTDVLVTGFMVVDTSDGALDFSMEGSACPSLSVDSTRSAHAGGGGGGAGKVSFQDLHFSSVHVQDSDTLLAASVTGGEVETMSVKGESKDDRFYVVKLTDVLISGIAAVDVDGALDLSSSGGESGQVSVTRVRKQGTEQEDYYTVTMTDLLVSSYSVQDNGLERSVAVDGGSLDGVTVTGEGTGPLFIIKLSDLLVSSFAVVDVDGDGALDFSMTDSQCAALSLESSHPPSADGTGGGGGAGKVSMSDLHFSSVRVLDSDASLHVSVTGGQGGSVDIEHTSQSSLSFNFAKVEFSYAEFSGSVHALSEGSLDFSMQNGSAGGVRVATGDLDGDGLEFLKVRLTDSLISSLVDVDADGALDLAMDRSRADSMTIRFSAPTSSPPPPPALVGGGSSVSMSNSRVVGRLTILGGDGDDQVTLSKMLVTGSTSISTGLGNDHLAILDSIFTGFASLNGGGGTDELAITKTTFFLSPFKLGWETISP